MGLFCKRAGGAQCLGGLRISFAGGEGQKGVFAFAFAFLCWGLESEAAAARVPGPGADGAPEYPLCHHPAAHHDSTPSPPNPAAAVQKVPLNGAVRSRYDDIHAERALVAAGQARVIAQLRTLEKLRGELAGAWVGPRAPGGRRQRARVCVRAAAPAGGSLFSARARCSRRRGSIREAPRPGSGTLCNGRRTEACDDRATTSQAAWWRW